MLGLLCRSEAAQKRKKQRFEPPASRLFPVIYPPENKKKSGLKREISPF